MKTIVTALVLAAASAGSPTQAQGAPFDGAKVIDSLDEATLQASIAVLGATTTPLDEEENTIRIAYPNGMRGVARRMACEGPETCRGLILLGYFTPPKDLPEERAQDALSRFGFEQVISSVVVNQEGEHVVKTYVMLDGGVTQANLVNWIGLFGESLAAYQQMLYAPAD